MRGRSLLIGRLLGVIVLVAAGFGADRGLETRHHDLLLRQQRANFTAGHSSYLTRDCQTAIPLLHKADVPDLNSTTAKQAPTEQPACQQLQAVWDFTETGAQELAFRYWRSSGSPDDDRRFTGSALSRGPRSAMGPKRLLVAGQYRIQVRFLSAAQKQGPQRQKNDYVLQGDAVLQPIHRYVNCVWGY